MAAALEEPPKLPLTQLAQSPLSGWPETGTSK
jgi:hypothetical protein